MSYLDIKSAVQSQTVYTHVIPANVSIIFIFLYDKLLSSSVRIFIVSYVAE